MTENENLNNFSEKCKNPYDKMVQFTQAGCILRGDKVMLVKTNDPLRNQTAALAKNGQFGQVKRS